MFSQILSVGAILLSTLLFLAGNGLLSTLIPVRGALDGFSTLAIGLIGSAYNIGFVSGCLGGPHLLSRVGHVRAFSVAAGLVTVMALFQAIVVDPWFWFLARVIYGFAAATMFMVLESWLNERAGNQNRGQIFSAYMSVNFGGIMAGQLMFATAPPSGFELFSIAAMFCAVCLIPVGLTRVRQPIRPPVPKLSPKRMFHVSPVGVAGCIAVGLANGAVWALAPLYAMEQGLSDKGIAAFMVAFTLGGTVIQLPVGRLSDHMDRRYVIAAICALAGAGGILVASLHVSQSLMLLVIALFGMLMLPLYGLSVAHANDRMERSKFVEASATLLFINAMASAVGPTVAALVMGQFGPSALFFFTAAVHLSMLVFVLIRLRIQDAPPEHLRDKFKPVPVSAQASPGASALDPRGRPPAP